MKLESGDASDDANIAGKTIFKGDDAAQQDAAGKTCYYHQFLAVHDDTKDPDIPQIIAGTLLPKAHEDPVGRSCYHPLFSRPPPAISL